MLDPAIYECKPPWNGTCGRRDAKIVLVGEAWGENEDALRTPFVGWSGYELSKMVCEAGLVTHQEPLTPSAYSSMMLMEWWKESGLLLTNVFAFRPPANKLDFICGKKAEVGKDYSLEPLGKGGYVLPRYLPELKRLATELTAHERTCIIALGAVPTWALLGSGKITKIRGVAASSTLCRGLKILPTYHPAGILRNWTWRPIAVADLIKVALREGQFGEVRRPERRVLINPTIQDVREWLKHPTYSYGVDLETKNKSIEMVGLARSRSEAIVIPLLDKSKPDFSYWSAQDEQEIWSLLRWRLEDPSIIKVFQNGLYDLQYFIRRSPVRPRNCSEDTMLLHHSLFPEMQKGLGFLGSLYTNEASWKLWHGAESEELKRDE